jgi:signal peptidase I
MASLYSFFIVMLVFPALIIIIVDSLFLADVRNERIRVAQASGADDSLISKLGSRPTWVNWARSLAPWLLLILIVRACIVEPFSIPSSSMSPQLQIGDQIVVSKFAYGVREPIFQRVLLETNTPQRGDVAVFRNPEHPSIDYIKRVIGLPGDIVIYQDKILTIIPACLNAEPCPEVIRVEQTARNETIIDSDGSEMLLFDETLNGVESVIARTPSKVDNTFDYFSQRNTEIERFVVPVDHYFMMGDNRDNSRDSRFFGFVEKSTLIGKPLAIALSIQGEPENPWYKKSINIVRVGAIQ